MTGVQTCALPICFPVTIGTSIRSLTKVPGETYEEYKYRVFENVDAMYVKRCDLMHNSDIRRLKGVRQKDLDRIAKYHMFYAEIEQRLQKEIK